ncbi:MAG: hypothetical protein EBE86_016710 [Hormoscilla sp. GUM202]|nr:hypothetical protein [Hormoscilla sp. GUM202]
MNKMLDKRLGQRPILMLFKQIGPTGDAVVPKFWHRCLGRSRFCLW